MKKENILSPKPSKSLKKSLKEVKKYEKGKIKSKGYNDIKKLFDDLAK